MDAQRWTVTALAKELGLDRATLSSYLTGRRSVPADLFPPLQKVLNVNPYALLGPENPQVAVAELVAQYGVSLKTLDQMDVPRHIWCDEAEAA